MVVVARVLQQTLERSMQFQIYFRSRWAEESRKCKTCSKLHAPAKVYRADSRHVTSRVRRRFWWSGIEYYHQLVPPIFTSQTITSSPPELCNFHLWLEDKQSHSYLVQNWFTPGGVNHFQRSLAYFHERSEIRSRIWQLQFECHRFSSSNGGRP